METVSQGDAAASWDSAFHSENLTKSFSLKVPSSLSYGKLCPKDPRRLLGQCFQSGNLTAAFPLKVTSSCFVSPYARSILLSTSALHLPSEVICTPSALQPTDLSCLCIVSPITSSLPTDNGMDHASKERHLHIFVFQV